jgi:hypothetical protein
MRSMFSRIISYDANFTTIFWDLSGAFSFPLFILFYWKLLMEVVSVKWHISDYCWNPHSVEKLSKISPMILVEKEKWGIITHTKI